MSKIQKCPRCGADVLDGYCYSCGIELPQTEPDEPQISDNPQTAYYEQQNTAYQETQTHAAYNEQQTVYPNIKVTDDIVYEKPIEEGFFTKYKKMSLGDKLGNYWWFILLSLLFPGFWLVPAVTAVVSLITYKREKLRYILDLAALALAGLLFFG
ncbi:MAG: hypothetical protein LBM59_04980 [Ruminococcus sp.]|jgi:hypothetical protein|nr:hypothetical protein [Ruminococcus sp.]